MKAKKPNQVKHPYSSDRPIASKKHDVLERSKFAEQFANDLQSWNGDDSLVVALYGAWGSGKTSVKNMVLEANHRKRVAQLPVIEFNPWQLSGTGNIPASFFQELGIVLRQEWANADAEKGSQNLTAYATSLSLAGTTANWVGKAMPLLGVPAGPMVEAFGASIAAAGSAAKEGSAALKAKNEAKLKSLQEQKRAVAKSLGQLSRPLLVVIDDIDRLTTDEILQVFQLVKANADFPRLIYLMLFDREVVSKALNAVSGDKGNEFLEKIVQVGYHIPHASRNSVQKVLFNGLNVHLNDEPVSKRWDKHRWTNLYADGIAPYFKNLRHVYRFLASFAFHVRQHQNKTSFEVDPVDLIGLETLRVFEPAVYESLPAAKTVLTRYEGKNLFGHTKQEVEDQALDQIAARSSSDNKDGVRSLLQMLFPPTTKGFDQKNAVTSSHHEWFRESRVCHPDVFDKYFTLTIPEGELSQAELDNLLNLASDAKGFVAACEALKQRGLFKITFERLDAFNNKIPLKDMSSLVQALCNLSDDFPEKQPSLLGFDVNVYAWRLVFFNLKQTRDTKLRLQILKEAFTNSEGFSLAVEIVSLDERVGDRKERGHDFLLEESELEELKAICVEKLRRASKTETFRKSPRLQEYFWRWSAWTTNDEVRTWLAQYCKTARDAAWVLRVLLQETHSFGQTHQVRYFISLQVVERFADIEKLTKLVERLDEKKFHKKEAIAIRAFRSALKRRAEGKPDDLRDRGGEEFEEVVD